MKLTESQSNRERVNVPHKDSFVEFLRTDFASRQGRNSRYSLHAYAKWLGMDVSNLAKILNGKIVPGLRLRKKISTRLGLPQIVDDNLAESPAIFDGAYYNLGIERFQTIARWYHLAILELPKLPHFRPESEWVAQQLGISPEEARQGLDRLRKLGLIRSSKTRGWTFSEDSSSTILDVATSAAHRIQQGEILELGIRALETVPIEKRSQTSVTLAMDSRKLPQAKALIKRFRRNLSRLLSDSPEKDSIYQLSVSLFPVGESALPPKPTKGK